MQESKEESNEESKETGKKRKITIKPKLLNLDTKEDSTDLVETNREDLKEIFTDIQLEELKKRYFIELTPLIYWRKVRYVLLVHRIDCAVGLCLTR